jgi:hypothetical protein
MNYFIKTRLDNVSLMLNMRGWVTRKCIMDRFSVGSATATRDLTYYRKNIEELVYNPTLKRYERKAAKGMKNG